MTNKSFVTLILLFFFSLLVFLSVYTYRKLQLYRYKSVYEAAGSSTAEIKRAMQEMSEAGNPAVPILSELLSKESDPEKQRLILGSLLRIQTPEAAAAASNALFVLNERFENAQWRSLPSAWITALRKTPRDDDKLCRFYIALRSADIAPDLAELRVEGRLSALAAMAWLGSHEALVHAGATDQIALEPSVHIAALCGTPRPWSKEHAKEFMTLLQHADAAVRIEAWLSLRDIAPSHIEWNPLQPRQADADALCAWLASDQ